jgi:Fe-S oxidoreductase
MMHDKLPKRYMELEERFITECVSCGVCVDACPCIPLSELRDKANKEISKEVKGFLENGNLSDGVVERAFSCSRCGICVDICPKSLDVYELQQALRSQILNQGKRSLALNQIKIGNRVYNDYDFDDILCSIQVKPVDRPWKEDIPRTEDKKEIVLFLGCSTRRYVDKVNVLLDILKSIDIDFLTLSGGRFCCGARAQSVGRMQEADTQGLQLVSVLAEYAPKQVLVICPACLHMLKKEIPKLGGVTFNVRHVFEIIVEHLNELNFTQSVNKKVTYHDPCKLGRMCGDYESARLLLKAIPGLNLVEMTQSKEKSNCCGGTAWRYNPNYAQALRKKAMECAKETHAELLATACNLCYWVFQAASGEYPFEVSDVLSIVGGALGIEHENKLMKYRSYHSPERIISEAMGYIAASPYSVEEMSRCLGRLLP